MGRPRVWQVPHPAATCVRGGLPSNHGRIVAGLPFGIWLGAILPHPVYFQIYQMVLDARASEHSARMVAMKSATDNAKQLIKDLTLKYNKVRQAAITTELLEITTAQMALG